MIGGDFGSTLSDSEKAQTVKTLQPKEYINTADTLLLLDHRPDLYSVVGGGHHRYFHRLLIRPRWYN